MKKSHDREKMKGYKDTLLNRNHQVVDLFRWDSREVKVLSFLKVTPVFWQCPVNNCFIQSIAGVNCEKIKPTPYLPWRFNDYDRSTCFVDNAQFLIVLLCLSMCNFNEVTFEKLNLFYLAVLPLEN